MSDSLKQPFYVGVNNSRFRGMSSDGFLPALEVGDFPERTEPEIKSKAFFYTKVDKQSLELDSQIAVLRGVVVRLDEKIKSLMASASKRKPIDTNKLTNLYRGVGGNEKDD